MLREANKKRNLEWAGGKSVSLEFRALELCNEVGELAGVVKKIVRYRNGLAGGKSLEDSWDHLLEEVGDAMISLDLLCMDLNIDIEKATRDKFNKTSEKMGLKTRL